MLVLSQSGETEEVVRLLPSLEAFGTPIIAITRSTSSTLGRRATVTLPLGPISEACNLGLAPSTSTTAMLAVGDALALVTSRMRGFGREDFARFHPGGSLGRQLSKVDEHMRVLAECRVTDHLTPLREVLVRGKDVGRRSGARRSRREVIAARRARHHVVRWEEFESRWATSDDCAIVVSAPDA